MSSPELDLSALGGFTPERVKDQYRSIIPQVMEGNPELPNPQEAFSHIRSIEGITGARLYGVRLADEASPLQAMVFNRQLLKLKTGLHIASEEEKRQSDGIEATFSAASDKLARLRGIPHQEADDILMSVLNFRNLESIDDAIERLTKGPKIIGFERTNLFEFDFTNDELRVMLEDSFGLDALVKSRLLEITKVDGFPVQCRDIAFGNACIQTYGARWEGGLLVLPDRRSYEQVEMQLEGVTNTGDLQHSFKLRAAADTGGGFATVKVREFVVEQPSHFDYLHDLTSSNQDKMTIYFLGIIAHETVHAMEAYAIDKSTSDDYRALVPQELSATLDHQFVTTYVDRHHMLYQSSERETFGEDFAETMRVYLTNADYLRRYFPRRYQFIQQNMPFVRENAILRFMEERRHRNNV